MRVTEYLDKYPKRQALALFCADFHSGQWSRGYKLLCRIQRDFKAKTASTSGLLNLDLRNRAVAHYASLVGNNKYTQQI